VFSPGSRQTTTSSGNQRIASQCDAKCDAISADHVALLARVIILVAGMAIPEAARQAVLDRVEAELEAANAGSSHGGPASGAPLASQRFMAATAPVPRTPKGLPGGSHHP